MLLGGKYENKALGCVGIDCQPAAHYPKTIQNLLIRGLRIKWKLKPQLVSNIISVNPYDYGVDFGGGIRRSSGGYIVGFFHIFDSWTPENRFFLRKVFNGGLHDRTNLPDTLFEELYSVGTRNGFRKMEYMVFKNYKSWSQARQLYGKVKVPVQLIDSQFDWSPPEERDSRRSLIPKVKNYDVLNADHFVSLEKPESIAKIVLGAAK